MKKIARFRSEEGAASIMEATIVFPLVFLVVIFLVLMGFTYAQKGYLTYHSSSLASYIAKVICYPGYNYLEAEFYKPEDTMVSLVDIRHASEAQAPYRYMFGLFGTEYKAAEDVDGNNLIEECAEQMAQDYLKTHGFLKSSGGTVKTPSDIDFGTEKKADGYACAISANTSRVVVYLGQNYVFGNFLRMIGVGGQKMTIYSRTTAFVSDSLEIVRMTDFAFDMVDFVMDKLGIDTSCIKKIEDMISKVTKKD